MHSTFLRHHQQCSGPLSAGVVLHQTFQSAIAYCVSTKACSSNQVATKTLRENGLVLRRTTSMPQSQHEQYSSCCLVSACTSIDHNDALIAERLDDSISSVCFGTVIWQRRLLAVIRSPCLAITHPQRLHGKPSHWWHSVQCEAASGKLCRPLFLPL